MCIYHQYCVSSIIFFFFPSSFRRKEKILNTISISDSCIWRAKWKMMLTKICFYFSEQTTWYFAIFFAHGGNKLSFSLWFGFNKDYLITTLQLNYKIEVILKSRFKSWNLKKISWLNQRHLIVKYVICEYLKLF